MARITLKHSNAPNGKLVPITVNIEHSDLVSTNDGELVFILTFDTNVLDKNKNKIDTIVIDGTTKENIKKEIQRGVTLIGDQISWEDLEVDAAAPRIVDMCPRPNESNVSINSIVKLTLKDNFPTTGIDKNSIKLLVNDIDVTNELNIKGADTEFYIRWIPVRKA